MEKFVPYAKLSKKKQREIDRARRGSWNGVNPVTRKEKNQKVYDRKKALKWSHYDDPFQGFCVFQNPLSKARKRVLSMLMMSSMGIHVLSDRVILRS